MRYMKITINLDCTTTELLNLGRKLMSDEELRSMFKVLYSEATKMMGPLPEAQQMDRYYQALKESNLKSIHMLMTTISDGDEATGFYEIDFSELEKSVRKTLKTRSERNAGEAISADSWERAISSRVGGLRKITDRLGIPPLANIARKDDEVKVCVASWAKPILEEWITVNYTQWLVLIEKYQLENPME